VAPEISDDDLVAGLKKDKAYAHVCPCGFRTPANDRSRKTKCCDVCPGCNQRILKGLLAGHTGTCLAYRQVTGQVPIDNSWWLDDDWLRRWSFGPPHIARLHEGDMRKPHDN